MKHASLIRNHTKPAMLCLQIVILLLFSKSSTTAFQEGEDPVLPEYITALAWSPDGTRIAMGAGPWQCFHDNADYSIRMINITVSSESIDQWFGGNCNVIDFDWNLDNTRLISASFGQGSTVWDASNGEWLIGHAASMPGPLQNRWKPGSSLIASINQSGREIILWDAETGKDVEIIDSGIINSISWKPDGSQLASASETGIKLWDSNTWQSQDLVSEPVEYVTWSPDGTKLAGIAHNGIWIKIWDVETGRGVRTFREHTDTINKIAWRPDNQTIASVSNDKTLRLWDIVLNQEIARFDHNGLLYAVAWSPDGNQLVYGGWREDNPIARPEIVSVTEVLGLVASAGENRNVVANASGSATITLDGSLSRDRLGKIVSYEWSENGILLTGDTRATTQVNLPIGIHKIVLTVSSDNGLTDTDEVEVVIIRPTPTFVPTSASASILTPTPSKTIELTGTNTP